jgi:RimJ/RimL family protein N-acetyltransferase
LSDAAIVRTLAGNRAIADTTRNRASGQVLAKIGMLHEGVARQHTMKWGQFEDLVLCGLLRSDAL